MGRIPAFILTLALSVRCEAYEDNIAMESYNPQRFSTLVPERYSGFLHRAGQLFSDANFGVKINNLKNDDDTSGQAPARDNSVRISKNYQEKNASSLSGFSLNPNIVKTFLGGKVVDDMQDELTNLLFGEENILAGNTTSPPAAVTEGDRAEEYSSEDYDLYSYDDKLTSRRIAEDHDLPIAAELRQRRPYRGGGGGGGGSGGFRRQRRPFRGRLTSPSQARPVVTRPLRDPMLHKIPGRIQKLPDSRPAPSQSSVDCDFYTANLCLGVRDYPSQRIASLLGADRRLGLDMIADVTRQSADDLIDGVSSNQEVRYDYSHYYGNRRAQDDSHNHRDFAEEGGFLCPSEIKYAKPKRGKTAQGVWKDIVNVDDYTQTLRMEKCLKPGGSCSYVSHHYKSQCSQVYNYHRLLSWDEERGLHMDIYKVPTCCSCHIMGYSYVYPPLKKQDQSPAIHQSAPPPPPVSFSNSNPGSGSSFSNSGSSFSNSNPGSGSSFSNSGSSFSNSNPGSGSSFSRPVSRPASRPPPPPPPPAQLTPDTFPRPPAQSGPADFDNFIPDFDPQEELQAFMNSIGDDFKDFNFEQDGPVRGVRRPGRPPSRQPSRPVVGGFQPISGDLRPPGPPRNKRRGQVRGQVRGQAHFNSVRRGDGFGPDGQPGGLETTRFEEAEDPLHKYQAIPVDLTDDNFVKKKLNTESEETNINYAYHPIIDFFTQS